MVKTELEFVQEGPFGYLIEKEPIEIAIIEADDQTSGAYSIATDHPLLYNIILDPKSIPAGFTNYKLQKVRGRRIGRTIDILLEKPIVCNETEEKHRILTFKGCGATPINSENQNWPIDPHNWHGGEIIKQLGRIWGGLTSQGAKLESQKDFSLLEQNGVLVTPYVASNVFPKDLTNKLFTNNNPNQIKLAQALRLTDTNILIEDIFSNNNSTLNNRIFLGGICCGFGTSGTGTITQEEFSKYVSQKKLRNNLLRFIDSLALTDRELNTKNKIVEWTVGSSLIGNCYANGRLKDFENLSIAEKQGNSDSVLESAYDEIMNLFGPRLLQSQSTFFPSYNTLKDYIKGDEPKKTTISKTHPIEITDKSILVMENEFELPPFMIIGHPLANDKGFGYGADAIFDSHKDLSLSQTIKLDQQLRKKGYKLATRAHLVAAYKKNRDGLIKMLDHEIPILTLSLIDHDTNILYDNLVLDSNGNIDLTKSDKRVVHNPDIGRIEGWDPQTAWPQIKEGSGISSTYYVSKLSSQPKKPGICEIKIRFDIDRRLIMQSYENEYDRYLPLAVYEFT